MEKGHTINVLDHGYVRYIDHMGDDQRICEAARISYKSPSKGPEADQKLLNYLWRKKHTSPFEMVKVTLNIKMPIFVMRQYVRHRMQNLNEVSARYTELPEEYYIPTEWRAQDTKNKQGSVGGESFNPDVFFGYNDQFGANSNCDATTWLKEHCKYSHKLYKQMISAGIAREMARMVLPVNIYTEIYACWDIKNLLHFITLRDDAHAQAEITAYSNAIGDIVKELFPWTWDAYQKYKWKLDET